MRCVTRSLSDQAPRQSGGLHCKGALVIEESADVRMSLASLIAHQGYAVHSARNGTEALEWLRLCEPPCLVLLDAALSPDETRMLLGELLSDHALTWNPVVALARPRRNSSARAGFLRKRVLVDSLRLTLQRFCGEGARGLALAG